MPANCEYTFIRTTRAPCPAWRFLSSKMMAPSSWVHWTLGILRHFRIFFPGLSARTGWFRVFPAPEQNPIPPRRPPLSHTVGWPLMAHHIFIDKEN
jgi:hypothetical protein